MFLSPSSLPFTGSKNKHGGGCCSWAPSFAGGETPPLLSPRPGMIPAGLPDGRLDGRHRPLCFRVWGSGLENPSGGWRALCWGSHPSPADADWFLAPGSCLGSAVLTQ